MDHQRSRSTSFSSLTSDGISVLNGDEVLVDELSFFTLCSSTTTDEVGDESGSGVEGGGSPSPVPSIPLPPAQPPLSSENNREAVEVDTDTDETTPALQQGIHLVNEVVDVNFGHLRSEQLLREAEIDEVDAGGDDDGDGGDYWTPLYEKLMKIAVDELDKNKDVARTVGIGCAGVVGTSSAAAAIAIALESVMDMAVCPVALMAFATANPFITAALIFTGGVGGFFMLWKLITGRKPPVNVHDSIVKQLASADDHIKSANIRLLMIGVMQSRKNDETDPGFESMLEIAEQDKDENVSRPARVFACAMRSKFVCQSSSFVHAKTGETRMCGKVFEKLTDLCTCEFATETAHCINDCC